MSSAYDLLIDFETNRAYLSPARGCDVRCVILHRVQREMCTGEPPEKPRRGRPARADKAVMVDTVDTTVLSTILRGCSLHRAVMLNTSHEMMTEFHPELLQLLQRTLGEHDEKIGFA